MMNVPKNLPYLNKLLGASFLFLLLIVNTGSVYGQSLSISVSNETPAQILERISEEIGVRFSYPSQVLNEETITFEAINEDLDKVLNRLLKPYGLGFEFIDGEFIAIKPIEDVGVYIQLIIADAVDKQPLPFSSVQVENSFRGAQANVDGVLNYFIREPNESVLKISYIGYYPVYITALDLYYQKSDTLFLQPDIISLEGFVVSEYLNSGIIIDFEDNSLEFNPNELNVIPGLSEPDALYSLQQIPGISSSTETASNLNIRGGTSDQVSVYWDNIPVYHSAHYFGLISSFIPSSIEKIDVYRNSVPIRFGGSASGLISMNSESIPRESVHGNVDMNMTHFSGAFSIPVIQNKMSIYVAGRRSLNDYFQSPAFTSNNEKLFDGSRLGESQTFAIEEEFDVEDILLFWDINAKLNYVLNSKNQFSGSYFSGRNALDFISIDQDQRTADFQYHNVKHSGFNLNWKSNITSSWISELSVSSSNYNLDFEYLFQREIDSESPQLLKHSGRRVFALQDCEEGDEECEEEEEGEDEEECDAECEEEEQEDDEENEEDLEDPNEEDEFFDDRFENAPDSLQDRGTWNNSLMNTEVKWINRLNYNRGAIILGAQINFVELRYSLREENAFEFDELRSFYEKGNSFAGFTNINLQPFESSNLDVGLRLNHFNFVDVTTLDPQLSYRHQWDRLVLKTSISRKHQAIRTLQDVENSISNTTDEIWFIADRESIPLIRNEQLMVGFVYNRKGWLLDVEAYHKNLTGLTTLGYATSGSTIDEFETGKETINGVDVLIRKRFKKLRNWISYSYSQSENSFEDLSEEVFVSQIDQPHKIYLNASYTASQFEFSLGWQFKSGLPYTPISNEEATRVEIADDNDSDADPEVFYEIDYGQLNSNRLPNYHRMDASVWYYFSGRNNNWTGKLGVSIQNIYNRTNILNRTYFIDQDGVEDENELVDIYAEQRQLLGFTPNVTLSISF
jgi:hypothetical protein